MLEERCSFGSDQMSTDYSVASAFWSKLMISPRCWAFHSKRVQLSLLSLTCRNAVQPALFFTFTFAPASQQQLHAFYS